MDFNSSIMLHYHYVVKQFLSAKWLRKSVPRYQYDFDKDADRVFAVMDFTNEDYL